MSAKKRKGQVVLPRITSETREKTEEEKKQIWLNLGCGAWLRQGFINLDIYPEAELRGKQGIFKSTIIEDGAEYVQGDIRWLPFEDDYADYVELFDVIEHIPFYEVVPALQEIHRVMKPGAKLVLITINMDALCLGWLNMVRGQEPNFKAYYELTQGMYGNQQAVGEYHRTPFNPPILDATITAAGFKSGIMWTIPRGIVAPDVGTIKRTKGVKMRYEMLVAEVTK